MEKSEIRKMIREKLMEGARRQAAGVLIKAKDTGNVLLLLRNDMPRTANTWALVGGGIDKGENILEGLKRELNEEMSIDPNIITYKFIRTEHTYLDFHYFEGFVETEFTPTLCEENLDFGWYPKDKLPTPLYPNMGDKIKAI